METTVKVVFLLSVALLVLLGFSSGQFSGNGVFLPYHRQFCFQFFADAREKIPLEFTVYEDILPGTVIKQFGNKPSETDKTRITGGARNLLEFDSQQLILRTKRPLSSKRGQKVFINISCAEIMQAYKMPLDFDLSFVVNVKDVNDPPVFVNLPATVATEEAVPYQRIIYKAVADDPFDIDEQFKQKTYSLLNVSAVGFDPRVHEKFRVDPQGNVLVLQDLDYEHGAKEYNLVIEAQDSGSPPLTNHSMLTVLVEDSDDQGPTFSRQNYNVTVVGEKPILEVECHVTAPPLLAVDQDPVKKSPINYRIIAGSPGDYNYWSTYFNIDNDSGRLCQTETIPRRGSSVGRGFHNFTLTIQAYQTDDHSKTATTSVYVHVHDRNIHAPKFRRLLYRATIPEYPVLKRGAGVVTVEATDDDFGLNGLHKFEIVNDPDKAFTVHGKTGLVWVNRPEYVNRELNDTITLWIKAVETHTNDWLESEKLARVEISVTDVNDNPPKFSQDKYEYDVKDNHPVGMTINNVQNKIETTDLDLKENGTISYQIKEVSNSWGRFSLKDYGRFVIDKRGNLRIGKALRDLRRSRNFPYYTLLIEAKDEAAIEKHRMSSTATVVIHVTEANNYPPKFIRVPPPSLIGESAPVGTAVANMKALDKDGDEDMYLKYTIVQDNEDGAFTISHSGFLVTAKPLDREKKAAYNLVVQVTDRIHTVNATVVVHLKDENDHAPAFIKRKFDLRMSENAQPNQYIGDVVAVDPDDGKNGAVRYRVAGGDMPFLFVIRQNGSLYLARRDAQIDREARERFVITVSARDLGTPPKENLTEVSIHLVDVNDNVPQFRRSTYRASVEEGARARYFKMLGSVRASDGDKTQENQNIRFSLTGPGSETFAIHPVTGRLQVKRPTDIDCEKQCNYQLKIVAADRMGTGLKSTSNLHIRVVDINDNKPEFPRNYTFRIGPLTKKGSRIATLRALDKDHTVQNNRVIYLLKDGGYGKFHVEFTTGHLVVIDDLLREPVLFDYRLEVEAYDTGEPRLSGLTSVLITVPISKPPQMAPNFNFSVKEDVTPGSIVGTMEAVDPDIGQGSGEKLAFFTNQQDVPFAVNTDSGEIRTTGPLDMEAIESYEFHAYVNDNGLPASTATTLITINLIDVNDNPPEFNSQYYQGEITEDVSTQGNLEIHLSPAISVTDKDVDPYHRGILFELDGPGSEVFSMDPQSASLRLKTRGSIDCEKRCQYSLQVKATDMNGHGLQSVVPLNITVIDVNDNSPVFRMDGQFKAGRLAPIGTVVGYIQTFDADVSTKNNRVLHFLRAGGLGKFSVEVESGTITVADDLTREPMLEVYTLEIEAHDTGEPKRFTSTTVNITVTLNTAPILHQFTKFEVLEHVLVGTAVGRVAAEDPDNLDGKHQHQDLLFFLKDHSLPFRIGPGSGLLETTDVIDRETIEMYTFMVYVKDTGAPPFTSSAKVSVTVKDTNDNPPVFDNLGGYTGTVTEDNSKPLRDQIMVVVPPISVSDADILEENRLPRYRLNGEGSELFLMDWDNGTIVVKQPGTIDCEIKCYYNLTISAIDKNGKGFETEAPLYVKVLDTNDNAPVFQDTEIFTTDRLTPGGTKIGEISALDGDVSSANHRISYHLEKGGFGKFSVNMSTGILTVSDSLLREPMKPEYYLVVAAVDSGTPSLSTVTEVTIHVPFNHKPMLQTETNFIILENSPRGSEVGRIIAFDEDLASNKSEKLKYFLERSEMFGINTDSGVMKTVGDIDREKYQEVVLTVAVEDSGIPVWTSTATVTITVKDVNDNKPVFSFESYQGKVTEFGVDGEDSHEIDLKYPVTASDDDATEENQNIIFHLSGDGSELFELDPYTAEIQVKSDSVIDCEHKCWYNLSVVATDMNGTGISTNTSLTITVEDLNDNAPVFGQNVEFQTGRLTSPGTVIGKLYAEDNDFTARNNRVIFLLREGGYGMFGVDVDTGEIIVREKLTRPPMKEIYELLVEAFDNGSPQLSTVAEIRIHVTLNTPPLVQRFVNVLLEENVPPNSLVTYIKAEDPDIGKNPDEYLQFLLNDSSVPFRIDEMEGTVYSVSSIDREVDETFTFTVYVSDHGVPAYTVESLVTIHVKDLNDNVPAFGTLRYNATVGEDDHYPIPNQVVKVEPSISTEDMDATEENRMVRYNLTGDGSDLFLIDSLTGVINVRRAGSLDCETQCKYNLTVQAIDKNGTGSTAESSLVINVLDANDNVPKVQEKQIFTTGRGAALGTSLGQVNAKDNDASPENSKILFYLKEGGFQKFAVDLHTGEVLTAANLTQEPMLSEYKLLVELYDTGRPQLSSSTELVIKVPKNNPPFADSNMILEVLENQPAGRVIGKIPAQDIDVDKVPGEKLIYSLHSESPVPFTVNISSGEITSLVSHDRESVDEYLAEVHISDNGLPSYTATTTLTLLIMDENDNAPVFHSEEGYRGVVIEDDSDPIENQRVTLIPPLSVEDKDKTEENRDVRFSISGEGSELFVINPIIGELKVKEAGSIDCEVWTKFDVKVTASDRGGTGLNTTTNLLIKVEDLNDNSPQLKPEYRFAVGRLTPVGLVIGQIKAHDRDSTTQNNRIHYSVTGGDGSGRFTVDLNTGNITLSSPLTTLPMKDQYQFTLEAYDTGNPQLSSLTQVYVDVPLNTPPRVSSSFYMSVFENEPVGTYVGNITVIDPDVTPSSKERLFFTFNDTVPFRLDKLNGSITTRLVLDREKEDRFVFPVLIEDNGAPPFTVTTTVTINVWDQNDHPPVFGSSKGYTTTVTENDSSFLNQEAVEVHPPIEADDVDKTSINRKIYYDISGPGSELFQIDHATGDMALQGKKPINCEDQCLYKLQISATDRNGTGLQTVTNLTIFVEDVNDNPPRFAQDYEFSLQRYSPVGMPIGLVKATDQDVTLKNNRVLYHIKQGSLGDFEIDMTSGEIRVAASLLREPHTEQYRLLLEAMDTGDPQLTATTMVKVNVPKNHAPLLPPSFQFEIAENEPASTRVGQIYAEDYDVDMTDAQNLHYWLEEDVPFRINNKSGDIYTVRSLDKEWEEDYAFKVFVKDDGVPPFTASTSVIMDIVDLNDNPPKFNSERGYKARITEDNILSVGIQELDLLPALIVTDDDSTKANQNIRYSLSGKGAGNFKISPLTGKIQAKYRKIDCERQCRYILDLIATDQAGKGNSTATKILVEVVDVNDNPPIIQPVYTFTTPRLSVIGTRVGKLGATDEDWTKKNNRLLYYLKDGGMGKFAVNITTGWIVVNTPLITTPMKEEYVLHVEVYDTGEPQLWALTEVIIAVPLNKPPSLPREMNFTTDENRALGEIIGEITASDPDLIFNPSEKLTYNLKDPKLPFMVEEDSGLIRAAGSIDLEEDDHFQFVVSVSDNGVPPFTASTTINVQVLDVNDHYPRFNSISGYMANIEEDDKNPKQIKRIPVSPRIVVTDGDETPFNQEIFFSLYGPGSNTFKINPVTADISVRRPGSIDCEKKCVFNLEISAIDQQGAGLESTHSLTIYVNDVNDHRPMFEKNYTFSVARASPIGSPVGLVQAVDNDATRRNNRILYSMRSNSKGDFVINIQTGEIVVANSLFDEPQREVYTFTVEATDTGDPPLSSQVFVHILVPMNHPPQMDPELMFTVKETDTIGQFVGEAIAVDIDVDQDPTQYLTYFMENSTLPFQVNASNGLLTTTKAIDSEVQEIYSFSVYVRDNGSPELTVSSIVTVIIEDINDHAPEFKSKRGYRGLVAENSSPDIDDVVVIPPIAAVDRDRSPSNRIIRYSLHGIGSESFHINPFTGDLSVSETGSIDCEQMCLYELKILAEDGKGLNSSANLTITVQDVNDEAPEFEIPDRYFVKSTTEVGAVVGELKAVDRDMSVQNNRVMYVLKDGGYGKFHVDVDSGDIMIADSLIREPMMEDYNLKVEAYDNGEPRLSASTSVKIFVAINHPPTLELFYILEARETVPIGTVIGEITAIDPDEDQTIEYILEDVTGLFTISKTTGVIKTIEYLDREKAEEHVFAVIARDNGNPPYTASSIISVLLEDVNDNAPVFPRGHTYRGYVTEDNFHPREGQIIQMDKNVTVVDYDATEENREVVLTLDGDQADLFTLDQRTGIIRTVEGGSIDRELQAEFNLEIVGRDQQGAGLETRVNLIIKVIDENDHAPIFDKPVFIFTLNHLATAGLMAGHVKAYDPDATKPNNDLLFMLEDDPFGKFKLDSETGKLYLLDSFFSKPRKEEYVISVSVTDMGYPANKAVAKVVIKAPGIQFNDFPPEFLGRTIFYLREELPVGTLVGRLNIIDKDKNNGSDLSISIDPESERRVPFKVDNNGNIHTTQKIDRDAGYFYFLFNVRATDSGSPALNTSQEIGVIMEDINDNPPQFTHKVYNHMVYDLFPPDTVVATPFAHDDLDTTSSVYRYQMTGGLPGYFYIDSKTGIVRTTRNVERLGKDTLTYTLTATDVYNRRLSATAQLNIKVIDSFSNATCCCKVYC